MAVSSGAQQILYPGDYLCKCADNFIACKGNQFLTYYRYKIGEVPDIDLALKVNKMRRILCERNCGLCPDEIKKLEEQLNKILL